MFLFLVRSIIYCLGVGIFSIYPLYATNDFERESEAKNLFTAEYFTQLNNEERFSNVHSQQQKQHIGVIETLPTEVWGIILGFLTNRQDFEHLRITNKTFAWLIQEYLTAKEQEERLSSSRLKITYWQRPPEERWLVMAEEDYIYPEKKIHKLEELKEIIAFLKEHERIVRTLSLTSEEMLEKSLIYEITGAKAQNFILEHLRFYEEEISLQESTGEIDELEQLLSNHLKAPSLAPEHIELSEIYYQDLRLNYYCSQLFKILGSSYKAQLHFRYARDRLDKNMTDARILYFSLKHHISPSIQWNNFIQQDYICLEKHRLDKNMTNARSFYFALEDHLSPIYKFLVKYDSKKHEICFHGNSLKEVTPDRNIRLLYSLGKALDNNGTMNFRIAISPISNPTIDKGLSFDIYEDVIRKTENKNDKVATKFYVKTLYRQAMMALTGTITGGTNLETAQDKFSQAANQGHAKAQTQLGLLYYFGLIDPPATVTRRRHWAEEKALFWWGHASIQGQSEAQFHLSKMYQKGYGIKGSKVAASEWNAKSQSHPTKSYHKQFSANYIHEVFPEAPFDRERSKIRNLMLGYFYHMNGNIELALENYKKLEGFPLVLGLARLVDENSGHIRELILPWKVLDRKDKLILEESLRKSPKIEGYLLRSSGM
jgi:TPR repeat protein